ncbi:MAG: hypothetical protein V3R99_09700 [Thermoguttaceae bacterium]
MSYTLLLAVSLSCVSQAAADRDAQAKLDAGWLKVCQSHAEDYVIYPTDAPKEKFKLLPNPVFRHSQPVRGDDIGGVWLWVRDDGRPGVVGTVFAYSMSSFQPGERNVSHEFHSLATVPLTATWRGRPQWAPAKAGIEWKPIPDAPATAESPTRRLLQMRQLSRRFHAHSVGKGERWELRLIAKPIYVYNVKDADAVLGGGLFAICQGTDPEILLGIEARRVDGNYRWHYACAPFSDYELHVRLDDTEVSALPRVRYNDRTDPHWWITDLLQKAKLPEEKPSTLQR